MAGFRGSHCAADEPVFFAMAQSNATMAMLVNAAKDAGLSWDCVLSTELTRKFKPSPAAYELPVRLLDLRPEEIVMVAAHSFDVEGALQPSQG